MKTLTISFPLPDDVIDQLRDAKLGAIAIEQRIGPGLSEYQREMLVRLAQEASEVAQAATKLLLHGITGKFEDREWDNKCDLSLEIGDLHQMVEECNKVGLIDPEAVKSGIERKKDRLRKYLVTEPPQ